MTVSVKIDAKGRFSIPVEIREELGIEPGDVFFIAADPAHGLLHLAKAIDPFDGLAAHAVESYRAGRALTLDEYLISQGIEDDGGN
jgi:AbrB family looped-hinge helix DNA binding protein